MKPTVKYELVEHPDNFHKNHWCIKINEGQFREVVYQYDTVSFNEEGEELILSFNTITIENPRNKDLSSKDFEDTIGDILTNLIVDHLEEIKNNVENGTGDIKESN
jgi:hypothetical protein